MSNICQQAYTQHKGDNMTPEILTAVIMYIVPIALFIIIS